MDSRGPRVRPLDLPNAPDRNLESTERLDSNLGDPEVDVRAPGPDDDVTFTVEESCGPGEFLSVHRPSVAHPSRNGSAYWQASQRSKVAALKRRRR